MSTQQAPHAKRECQRQKHETLDVYRFIITIDDVKIYSAHRHIKTHHNDIKLVSVTLPEPKLKIPESTGHSNHFKHYKLTAITDVAQNKLDLAAATPFAPSTMVLGASKRVDLRFMCPPIWDQGQLGSCVSFAVAFLYRYAQKYATCLRPPGGVVEPAPLFMYYCQRDRLGWVSYDSGSTISMGMTSLAKDGTCTTDLWPYDISKFTVRPGSTQYLDAKKHRATVYSRLQQLLPKLTDALARGRPVVLGISVYESWYTFNNGVIPMPHTASERLLGGHAIALVGYDIPSQTFIFRNSWGTDWGDKGYGYIPIAYILSPALAGDMWILDNITMM